MAWRKSSDTVALIWHGYLTGLLEWGLIEFHVFEKLVALLSNVGNKELLELSLDEPITEEQEAEIEEYLRKL